MKCDELLPVDAERCEKCGALVAEMKFDIRSNLRAVKLAAQQVAKENQEKQKKIKKDVEFYRRLREAENTPVAARVVSTSETVKSKGSVIGTGARMAMGGALFGPMGVLLGAATSSRHTYSIGQKVTFSVKYKSGRTGTETVSVGSDRFKELAALVVDG